MMLGVFVLARANARVPLLWCNGLWVLWAGSCLGVWVSFYFGVLLVFFLFSFFSLFWCPFCIPPVFLGVRLHFFLNFYTYLSKGKKLANSIFGFMKIFNLRPLSNHFSLINK